MSEEYFIKIEDGIFWREVRKENIEGNIYCPVCKTVLVIIPGTCLFAYCPNCKKYYEPIKRCRECGAEYNINKLHICD